MIKFQFTIVIVTIIQAGYAQTDSIDYLGQTPPGSTPVIFAPGIVSIEGRYEYGLSVSPGGKEIYYTTDQPGDGLTVTKYDGEKWTVPEIANLRGNHSCRVRLAAPLLNRQLCPTGGSCGWQPVHYLIKAL